MKATMMKCPSCGGDLIVDTKDRTFFFCNYCGKKIHLDNEGMFLTINNNINIDKNENKHVTDEAAILRAKVKDRVDRRECIMMIICFVLLLLPFAISMINSNVARNQGKIHVGYYKDYIDQKYEVVVKQMEAAGFTNIEIIDLDEPGLLGRKKEKVQSISIAGDSTFDSDDWFYPSDIVIISHY